MSTLPAADFFVDYYETALEHGELVVGVEVPALEDGTGTAFLKYTPRSVEDYATVSACAVVRLDLDGVCRAARLVLGAVGTTPIVVEVSEALEGDVTAAVDRALVAISAELVGVCSRALDMTVSYVKERKQFGTPVGAYQAVSHRCAQMLLDTEKARVATSFAAWAAGADPERLGEAAVMAKAAASDAGREVTASAIQAHGGIGFTWEADVHWLYKRAQVDAALLGGAGRHRQRLAAIAGARAAAPAAS